VYPRGTEAQGLIAGFQHRDIVAYMTHPTRRSLLASALLPAAALAKKKIPVSLELYSVRNELTKDLFGTVTAVAKMGYEGVEFYSPYTQWTTAYAKDVRKLMDDLGIKCFSTHNGANSFLPENTGKAIELNQILGSKYIVMASAGRVEGLDGWKKVAERLTAGAEKMRPAGIRAGFHNHQVEFKPIDGTRPMEVLAKNTPKDVCLQLDVGTCVEAGSDPVAWVKANAGRIHLIHLKDWGPEVGYKALLGEGAVKWKELMKVVEKQGGLEYYIVEQEGSRFPPLETAEKCLANFRKLRK
jgi:sugar phosphate isomerase/epimerase